MLPGQMSSLWLASVKDGPRKLPIKFGQIGSVTVGIFLIWINVTRTNVIWTNVTVTFGISFRCSQELTFKVSSKSGQ